LRRSEICNLQWQDIDFQGLRLEVIDREGAHTKTRQSRVVALRQESATLLAQLYENRKNEYVFTNPKTFNWACGKWFRKLVQQTRIDRGTLHDLRKTCNTLMKNAGVSTEAAMQVLGHSSIEVNQRYYTGVLTEQQRIAVNSLPSVG
jgi:integrase